MRARNEDRSQLEALGGLHDLFQQEGIAYWIFGGWAVDFHVGRVTRPHADIDLAVWLADLDRIDDLLRQAGWQHTPQPDEDGYTLYRLGALRLEIAFLAGDDDGVVYTPIQNGRGDWPIGSFGDDVVSLQGVRARVVTVSSLLADKSEIWTDPSTRAKDQADVALLVRLQDR